VPPARPSVVPPLKLLAYVPSVMGRRNETLMRHVGRQRADQLQVYRNTTGDVVSGQVG